MTSQIPVYYPSDEKPVPAKELCAQPAAPAPTAGDIDDFIFADDEYYVSQR